MSGKVQPAGDQEEKQRRSGEELGRKPNISARNWDYVWGSNSRGFSGEGGEEWGFSSMTDDSQEVSRGQAIRYGSVSTRKGVFREKENASCKKG